MLVLPLFKEYTAAVMMPAEVSIRVGNTLTTERGVTISVVKRPTRRIRPGSTALHEAAHIEAAGEIFKATIIGSDSYLGATWPVVMTAAAAMAAEALGHDGTGHDRAVTKYALGVDPDKGIGEAITALAGRHDYIYAVASKLQEFGTIGQPEVNDARNEVDNERAGNWDVSVHMKGKDGSTDIYMRRSVNHEVTLPGEMIAKHEEPETTRDAA